MCVAQDKIVVFRACGWNQIQGKAIPASIEPECPWGPALVPDTRNKSAQCVWDNYKLYIIAYRGLMLEQAVEEHETGF